MIDAFPIKEPYLEKRAISCPEGYSAINDARICERASKNLGLSYLVDNDSDSSISGICAWCNGWGCNPKGADEGIRIYRERGFFSRLICQMKGKYKIIEYKSRAILYTIVSQLVS